MLPPLFTTPKGREVKMTCREGTADWNTCQSVMTEDEYHLKDLNLSGVAIDVGAYIGSATVALLLDNPGLTVIAVEPLPENIEVLRENLGRTGVAARCIVMEAATGYGSHSTIWYDFDGDDGSVSDFAGQHRYIGNAEGHFTLSKGNTGRSVTVLNLTIPEMVPDGPIALLKVDCEGGEWGLFENPSIRRVERIVGEWHPRFRDEWMGAEAELTEALGASHDVRLLEHETFVAELRA